jgi:hypothetical protein
MSHTKLTVAFPNIPFKGNNFVLPGTYPESEEVSEEEITPTETPKIEAPLVKRTQKALVTPSLIQDVKLGPRRTECREESRIDRRRQMGKAVSKKENKKEGNRPWRSKSLVKRRYASLPSADVYYL